MWADTESATVPKPLEVLVPHVRLSASCQNSNHGTNEATEDFYVRRGLLLLQIVAKGR